MKKFLFVLITLFIYTNNVFAAELPSGAVITNSCSRNLMKPANWVTIAFKSKADFTLVDRTTQTFNYVSESLIPVDTGSTVCFSQEEDIFTSRLYVKFLNSNFEYENTSQVEVKPKKDSAFNQCIGIPDNSKYMVIFLTYTDYLSDLQATNLQVELNEVTDYVAYEECVVEEPDEETPESDTENTIISIDYTIFYVIAVLICTIFIYKFLNSFFSGKR